MGNDMFAALPPVLGQGAQAVVLARPEPVRVPLRRGLRLRL